MAERTTDTRIVSHRRLVVRTLVTALRSIFTDLAGNYKDRQLTNLKITTDYPLKQEDYPCVTVEYNPSRNMNAGVGHEEWFADETNVLRKWNHRRFEGSVTFHCFALTPLDRDVLVDAIEEVLTFGRLDAALAEFFYTIYGHPDDPVRMIFSQLMLNTDVIQGEGNSASLAPWNPEDQLIHDTSISCDIHGGLYNVVPQDTWGYVTAVSAQSYPQFEENIVLPFNDPAIDWTNPFEYDDDAVVTGTAVISGADDVVNIVPPLMFYVTNGTSLVTSDLRGTQVYNAPVPTGFAFGVGALNHDGSKILLTLLPQGGPNSEIVAIPVSGGASTTVWSSSNAQIYPNGCSWSQDGSKITFGLENDTLGTIEIWRMNADGTGLLQITNRGAGHYAYSSNYSKTFDKIVYVADDGLHVVNGDGTGDALIPNTAGASAGAWIDANTVVGINGTGHLFTATLAGVVTVLLASTGVQNVDYSPMLGKIIYQSYNGTNYEFHTLNTDGTGAALIPFDPTNSYSYPSVAA